MTYLAALFSIFSVMTVWCILTVGQLSPNLIKAWRRECCVPTANPTTIIGRTWDEYPKPDLLDAGFSRVFPASHLDELLGGILKL